MAVDQDKPDPTKSTKSTNPVVRYTLAQRQKDMRTRQYDDESRRTKPQNVVVQEEEIPSRLDWKSSRGLRPHVVQESEFL